MYPVPTVIPHDQQYCVDPSVHVPTYSPTEHLPLTGAGTHVTDPGGILTVPDLHTHVPGFDPPHPERVILVAHEEVAHALSVGDVDPTGQ
jgi:hypothetical protein